MWRILFDGRARWGVLEGDHVRLAEGITIKRDAVVHLPPCEPSKIICIHLNYDSRRVEFREAEPEKVASYFFKPPSSLNVHKAPIYRPRGCSYLNYEGEVGVVIGKEVRCASREEAWDAIAGFSSSNDVGLHDFRGADRGSMMRVKGMDGFCPIGPGLVSGIDLKQSTLRTYINGKVVQETPVRDMTFDLDYIIADLSRYMTLLPGDLILSGTPENSRPMNIGDVVEVEVTNVGRLTNTILEAAAEAAKVGFPPTVSREVRRVSLGGDFYNLDETAATR
jgi:5-oxopent-3-ene-1,2,5-tricarboxylate decarboxylase/2-hydroxyhepta-2,4-diene-1,7-dioate isomerase